MIARRERFSGNILLYDYLSAKRAPTFLNRNLTRALRIHQHLSKYGSLRDFTGEDHRSRLSWEPPSWDQLDDMMNQSNVHGSFVLEIHSIQPVRKVAAQRERNPARKNRVLWRSKGVLQVSVFESGSDLPCFSSPAQEITLKQVANDNDQNLVVEADSVMIKPQAFGTAGIQSTGTYRLSIGMTVDSQDDAANVYQSFTTQVIDANNCSTRFTTSFENMLECPNGREILSFRDYKTGLAFGLEVSMHWRVAKEVSILAAHNASLRAMALPNSYPSPPPDSRSSPPALKLVFVYANEKLERTELVCPHEGCQKRKVKDVDGLRLHLDFWHDYFRYRARLETRDVNRRHETWIFESEVADHRSEQRASARADEPMDIQHIAPCQPFNQSRYLNEGNTEFQRETRQGGRPPAQRPILPSIPMSSVPLPPRRKPPDVVADMTPREKLRHPVPQAPAGTTFIRAQSRRPLRTGEFIYESDDEVEDTWIQLRKIAEFNKDESLPNNVKQFLTVFDQHMWEEHVETDFHVTDSITRFSRDKGAWIWQEDVFDLFKQKLDELLEDQLILKKVYDSYLEIVHCQKHKADNRQANELSQQLAKLGVDAIPRSKGKGKAKVTETGNLTPVTADSDGDLEMREIVLNTERKELPVDVDSEEDPPYDLCICGLDAQVARAQIDCSSMVSKKQDRIEH